MKSYPVVLSLSLAASGCLLACSSSNGDLFEEMPAEGAAADEPPADVPSDTPGNPPTDVVPSSPSDGSDAPDSDAPSSETPNDDDLPLSGELPMPPANGMPDPSETPEPPAPDEPEGPVVVSVTPADGAVGVDNEQNIVIAFSAPMNREATEAAYQS
ncbi:MAG TPA: Ig-like domain-containing protein, partial [Polyangiaceae bacterium]|nr:Ig-like domain-containing protein [Polyangiaceae bacterium]